MALVIGVDAKVRVGEPDRAIRMLNDVIGAVEPVTVAESADCDRAIMLGSGHPTPAVLTGHESALPVDRTTVRKAGWCEEDVSTPAHLVIAKHPIVGDVAEQHESTSGVVGGSLQPPTTGEEPRDRTVASVPAKRSSNTSNCAGMRSATGPPVLWLPALQTAATLSRTRAEPTQGRARVVERHRGYHRPGSIAACEHLGR